MNRVALAGLGVAAVLLAGCPIPQAVPEYPKGTSITPPRIVAESAKPIATLLQVPAGCATPPSKALSAGFVDENVTEPVEARWFVDYDPADQQRANIVGLPVLIQGVPQPNPNAPITGRDVPPFTFLPYQFGGVVGTVHVVELVLSNGFNPGADVFPAPAVDVLPWRTPLPGFETQVYRWVFLLVPPSATVPCPP